MKIPIFALLINGEIKQYGTPKEIYEKPNCKEVSDFFGRRNYIDGYIKDGKFISRLGIFKTKIQDSKNVTFMFRPEEIKLGDNKKDSIKGIIKSSVYSGEKITYEIKTENQEIYYTTYSHENIQVNDEVYINLDFSNAAYFINSDSIREGIIC